MLLATAGAGVWQSPWPLLGGGGVLLAGLVVMARGDWTPHGPFGPANWVTGARAVLLAGLPLAAEHGGAAVLGGSLLFVAGDGLDGWLARRTGQASAFGAFFDKETDALFLLLLCALAAFEGRLSLWILGVGLLRYGFVVVVFLLDPPDKTEDRSTLARYLYGTMVAALLFSFLPYPRLYRPLVGLAAGGLAVSFGRSLWGIVSREQAFGEAGGTKSK